MRKFDYSFLSNGLLPAKLINLTSGIASLKTMAGVRKEEYAKVFTELEAVAKVQSVKSSNAIEGIVTSDERIAAIVNRDSAPLNHTEGEIAGYRDALNAVHLYHDTLDLKQSDILRLHETMMQIAGYEYGGQYKTGDNYIIEEDKSGNRKVRFKPTSAHEVEEAMEQLKKNEVHLLIMDIMMPKLDGIRATMKIREKYSVPIIFLSAKSQDADKILGLNVGADDYITKPFLPLLVKEVVYNMTREL